MKIKFVSAAALLALLAACAATPPKENSALQSASQAVAAASQDSNVNQYAPVELKKAKDSLNQAGTTWRSTHNQARTDYLAYLAKRHAQIAQAMGKKGAAQAQAKQAAAERDKLRLQASQNRAQQLQGQLSVAKQQQQMAQQRQQQAQQAAQQNEIQELKRRLAALKPRQTSRGIVLTLGNVLFALNSAQLNSGAQHSLNGLADFLRKHPHNRVRVEGYTDSTGTAAYNQQLSERRAQAVANAMIQRGVGSSRMTVVGYGEADPVASNSTASGRAQNRRVEFVILNANARQPTSAPQAASIPQPSRDGSVSSQGDTSLQARV